MTEYGNGGDFTVVMEGPFALGGGSSSKLNTIMAPVDKWKGAESPYSQVVDLENISVNTVVFIQLSVDQIEQLRSENKDIALTVENQGGIATLYAVGNKPSVDLEIQATLVEVVVV